MDICKRIWYTISMQENEIKKLKISYWLLEHRKGLKKLLIYFLIILNLYFWGVAIYQFVFFLLYRDAYNEMISELTENKINYPIYKRNQPLPLVIGSKIIIPLLIKNEYDLIAEAENPDSRWLLKSLKYKFIWENGESDFKETFFLPGEKKYLFALNQKIENFPKNLQVKLTYISYQRIRPQEKEVLLILPKLKFKKIKFYPAIDLEDKKIPAQIEFEAVNQSAYSFWQVNAIITFYQGERIVGFVVYPLRKWKAGEKRKVKINLSSFLSSVTLIKIKPEVNVFDESVFIPLTR